MKQLLSQCMQQGAWSVTQLLVLTIRSKHLLITTAYHSCLKESTYVSSTIFKSQNPSIQLQRTFTRARRKPNGQSICSLTMVTTHGLTMANYKLAWLAVMGRLRRPMGQGVGVQPQRQTLRSKWLSFNPSWHTRSGCW